jgi:hypothetical protein
MSTGMRAVRQIASSSCVRAMSSARPTRTESSLGPKHSWWLAISICILLVGMFSACDGQVHKSAGITNPPDAPLMSEDYGDTDCPPDVAPADCVRMTDVERQMIADDINLSIRWEFPECAQVGYAMIDFALTGDMRKFPESSSFWAWWQRANYSYPGQPEQISFEQSQFQQGWSSRRITTGIHEGTHLYRQQGNEAELTAQYYENHCVNW